MLLQIMASLKYSITPIADKVLLRIWEPAPVNEFRAKPFLFMAKHRLLSEDEAQEVLNEYMTAYHPPTSKVSSGIQSSI